MKTERSRLRRKYERGHYDQDAIFAFLDAMPLAHIAFIDEFGLPACLPSLQWREGNHVYWHASSAARSFKAMAGQQVCLTVTALDGLVFGRSPLNHSANYRSAMIYGQAHIVPDAQKAEKLQTMFDVLYPGRWEQLRPMSAADLKQTAVMGLEITEASLKIRDAGPNDHDIDGQWPVWTGIIPCQMTLSEKDDDPHNLTGAEFDPRLKNTRLG